MASCIHIYRAVICFCLFCKFCPSIILQDMFILCMREELSGWCCGWWWRHDVRNMCLNVCPFQCLFFIILSWCCCWYCDCYYDFLLTYTYTCLCVCLCVYFLSYDEMKTFTYSTRRRWNGRRRQWEEKSNCEI